MIHELVGGLSISSSSATCFRKRIGLNNSKELMYLHEQHLNMQNASQISNTSLGLQSEYLRIPHLADQNFNAKAVKQVCGHICEHHIISIFALGLGVTAAGDFCFRFSRLGKSIEVIHDKDAIKMSSRVLQKQGLAFIFTLYGDTYLGELTAEPILREILVVSTLGNQSSRPKKLSDAALYTSSLFGEKPTGMMPDQTPVLIMIDMLYYHYVCAYSGALTNWVSTEEILRDREE